MKRIECEIERDRYTPGRCYVVTVDGIPLDVTVVTWHHQADLKDWLSRVRRLYTKKNRKIVVGINARNSHNAVGSCGFRKDMFYQMLQICVGQYCLLIEIEPYLAAHRSLKYFFREFFRDDVFVFVGVGIKDVAAKIYIEYKDTDFKGMSVIPNPVDLRELAAREPRFGFFEGRKCGLEMLVKYVLGVIYEKPERIAWYGGVNGCYEFSDELILWSSVEVYLMAKIGMTLSYKSCSLGH